MEQRRVKAAIVRGEAMAYCKLPRARDRGLASVEGLSTTI